MGRRISETSLEEMATYCKGELGRYDKKTDEVTFELDDTNLPYLWSVEGIARLLRGILGVQRGLQEIKVSRGKYSVEVDLSVSGVRPFIAAFVAKGKKVDSQFIKQLVQLQEKFCDGYGRKRQKVSIGLYSYKRIKFPVSYKAARPESVRFVPLGFSEEMDLSEIIERHPKGKDYGWILKDFISYPVLVDGNGSVLSFPPIINSDSLGKVEEGDSDIFFEVTGTDEPSVILAANIFAYALSERGFELFTVEVKYPDRKLVCPVLRSETMRITRDQVRGLLGLDLKDSELKKLLERFGYSFNDYVVSIPPYRADIMHPFDVIEDVAIAYGFWNIPSKELESYSSGCSLPVVGFIDRVREIVIGLGYQELMSPILSNKAVLYDRMCTKDVGTVEIDNYMSELFSVVRTWLTPMNMEVLSKNKHVDFPQMIFEQGLVTERDCEKIADYEKISIVSSHSGADFTEAKQVLEYLMRQLGISFEIREAELGFLIPGRAAEVFVSRRRIGFLGEISPQVLENWGIEMPVAALELNVSALFDVSVKND
ncbi:phenylalanine--tRNA ligase subunit beta [Candidatus Woesearchaeota archaeon]|nr:phenylalanine--tRNA ligase subunit beta [Candidatus Woesearchaeota archaeon]